jgi:hypothetical protein
MGAAIRQAGHHRDFRQALRDAKDYSDSTEIGRQHENKATFVHRTPPGFTGSGALNRFASIRKYGFMGIWSEQ